MKDLIERQAAIDKINERQRKLIYCFGFENDMVKIMNVAKSIIIAIPSAQPENIRCYECKHGTHSGCGNVYICNVSPELVMKHTGDFYCGYAKRKTDGGKLMRKLIDLDTAIDAVVKESQVDGAYGYMDTKSIVDLLNDQPSVQPEYEPVKAEDFAKTMSANSLYGFMAWHGEALELMERQGFVICKKTL